MFRNSSVRLVYAIDADVTRSLASPQMRCVVQVRVLPSGAGRVKHRRFRQSLMKEYHQSNISGCSSAWPERYIWDVDAAGSNPVIRTRHILKFRDVLKIILNNRYAGTTVSLFPIFSWWYAVR